MEIGGYIVGHNHARFKKTKEISKFLNYANEHYGSKDAKSITRHEAVELLNHFPNGGKLAIKEIPVNAENIRYFAYKGSLDIYADRKHVIQIVRKLRNPLTEFVKTIPKRLLAGLRK